ncbi:MAG: hypothetical protein ACLQGT_10220 [Terracidiphilus sp.]
MARDYDSHWQPPSRLEPGKKRFAYIEDILGDGEGWLQKQPFWNDLDRAEKIIRGMEMNKADENRSDLTSNRLKRIGREMVAAISDVRYPDDIWNSDNKAYAAEMEMFSKMARAVWYEARAPYAVRRLTQWMLAGGTGYFWPVFRRRRAVDPGSTGICFDDYGPRDVVPFMIDERNWQETYGCTMVKMVSLHKAHALFPTFQDRFRPVPKRRMQSGVVSSRMNFISSLRGSDSSIPWVEKQCELRYTLIRDLSINDTDIPVPMGDAGASWAYVVPYLGMDIAANDVKNGQRYMRPATIDDCRLYPNMRLMVTASGVEEPVYDGPAWDWHGYFPPRFSSDDWVTEPMGLSIFRDVFDLERARQFTERAIDMKVKAQMDPGMAYDQTKINPGTAEELDPWEMRKRLGVDGEVDEKTFRTILTEAQMKVGAEPFEWIKYLDESQDYYLGTNQVSALAKAKMGVIGQEGADDLLRIAGPITRDICAGMEGPMADVLEMQKYQDLQFFDTARTMRYVGPDGVTPETFDFDPVSLVPSHMPGEDNGNSSQFSRMERAKNFARGLSLTPTPGYLHGIPQTQQKLLLLQGWRSGFPIDPARVAKVYGIENWETSDFPKWKEYKKSELEFAAKMKEEGASLLPPGAQQQPAGGGGSKGGRPPSGNKPPAAKTKGSAEGPRATVSTSG